MPKPSNLSEITKPILHTRRRTANILGLESLDVIIRLEKSGRLRPIRLVPRGMVFYTDENVREVAKGIAA